MPAIYGSDAYSPKQIAYKVEQVGVTKAKAPFLQTFMLGVLAGGFIAQGALFYTVVVSDVTLAPAFSRLLGGLVFATGYIVAILAGAEVFTSNNLLAMTYAAGKISIYQMLRNWGILLVANGVGAIGLAVLFIFSGLKSRGAGAIGETAYALAHTKAYLPFYEAFFLAIIGNLFVCIAVWVSLAGRSVADKVVAVLLPLTALGAIELEHITASLYFLPRGYIMQLLDPGIVPDGANPITLTAILLNFIPIILGNIVGGSLMVSTIFYVIYRRGHENESVEGID
ncbi:MAG: formate/nitrite transporter family protein [Verrucomicrobia bacterium]|nr:formate/nitrite transporter family protein [Verrucomicrobiota bacterium]